MIHCDVKCEKEVFGEGQTIVKILEMVLLWVLETWLPFIKFDKDFKYLLDEF